MRFSVHRLLAIIACLAFPQHEAAAAAATPCAPGLPCVSSSYTPGSGANDDKRDNAQTCDGDFMNQIYARAFLEGQRDMMYAQTYIRKPDSTLEYTCFDRYLNNAASRAAELFSETDEWDGRAVPLNIAFTGAGNPTSIDVVVNMGSGHIVDSLTDVVSTAMGEFLENFDHDFLGGAGGMNYAPSDSVSPGSYSCGSMGAIWQISKCQNFPSSSSLFYTFEELATNDIRTLPDTCPVNGITSDMVITARNAPTAFATAEIDPIVTHYNLMQPATSDAECLAPIPTGLTYFIYNVTPTAPTSTNPGGANVQSFGAPEKVCANPGCYYHVDMSWGDSTSTPPTVTSIELEECRRG